MNIDNLILGDNSVTVSYLIHYDSLLQNATDIITKCNGCCIAKCDRSLLQNASGFLIQNATVLLQNVTVTTNCDNFITKCDSYYKMRRLLQIATVQRALEISTHYFFPQFIFCCLIVAVYVQSIKSKFFLLQGLFLKMQVY